MRFAKRTCIAVVVFATLAAGIICVTANNRFSPTRTDYPSHVLNLKNWKLSIPIDTKHSGNPDEIKQPQLASYKSEYFGLSSTKNGVVFKANVGGKTIPGSDFARTELREMSKAGMANASWTSNNKAHGMTIVQAVTHLPSVRPSMVVGQIHDADGYVLLIRLDGTNLSVKAGGVTKATLDTSYILGTPFTITIVSKGDRIKIRYNNDKEYSLAATCKSCYFKAGAYLQTNTSKGDSPSDYGEVTIYKLNVTP